MTVSTNAKDRVSDFGRDELDTEISAFMHKVGSVIDEARSKMSDEERDAADRKAKAILEESTSGASGSRRSA